MVLCAASAPGCFTVVSSTSLDISSMPAHAAAAVTVKVVTLGTSASTTYTYNRARPCCSPPRRAARWT